MSTRLVPQHSPILHPVFAQMPNRDDRRQGIMVSGGHGWVKPSRGMKVKAGIGGHAQVALDALEVLPVVIRQEKRMRTEVGISPIQPPRRN